MPESPTSPLEVVEAFLDAFETMDMEAGLALVAEDCEYTNVPLGTVRGHAGILEVLGPFSVPIERNEFIIHRNAEAGPIVFVERLDRHLLKTGEWRELAVTGVFEVHDGLITVWRDYFDGPTAALIHAAPESAASESKGPLT